jgi:hypothetical protein
MIPAEIADQLHLAQSGLFEHLNEWSVGKGTTQSSGSREAHEFLKAGGEWNVACVDIEN